MAQITKSFLNGAGKLKLETVKNGIYSAIMRVAT